LEKSHLIFGRRSFGYDLLRLKKHGQNGGKSGKNCNRQKVNLKGMEKSSSRSEQRMTPCVNLLDLLDFGF
jgi:hypothetical protein